MASKTSVADRAASAYPGQRFGLPESGPGSVAPMWRRFAALWVDWGLCTLIAVGLLRSTGWALLIFAVEAYLLTAVSGLTVGKRLLGIRAIRVSGGMIGFKWAAVRVLLLLAVVPALLSDRDLRGLHDRAANTVVVLL